ncbi:hypothetical protein ABPG74_002589 [Tetrahymena malaccensis]
MDQIRIKIYVIFSNNQSERRVKKSIKGKKESQNKKIANQLSYFNTNQQINKSIKFQFNKSNNLISNQKLDIEKYINNQYNKYSSKLLLFIYLFISIILQHKNSLNNNWNYGSVTFN